MPRPPTITHQQIAPILMAAREPVSATDLAARFRVNRTTIVRTLADFGDALITMGATRSTRYALRRPVGNAGSRWPLYRIGEDGRAVLWATVESLYERRWRVTWSGTPPEWAQRFSSRDGLWEGFPLFLADMRPQGFLGRIVARAAAGPLGLPENPQSWSGDHTLLFLQAAGEDMPGALVLGDGCLRRALGRAVHPLPEESIAEAQRPVRYAELALAATTTQPGSSAGGEQPKFLTTITAENGARRPVLVKFSPPADQPAGQRWADLLLCEWHASALLAERGLAHPGAQLLDAGGRRFLEVPRFDRTAAGGRIGVVSLMALHPESAGHGSGRWPEACAALQRAGLISTEATATATALHYFGELTGNDDMHAGNLAFFLTDTLPLPLAPCYDMLPMLWRPTPQGEILPRRFAPAPPVPAHEAAWRTASDWAVEFWQRVAADSRLSPEFQSNAADALATVQRMR